ncbi:MAG: hypothetical protein J6L96_03685 [Clostridia bacterium]|nr:hypothetical protein [Clostridia bacterium]
MNKNRLNFFKSSKVVITCIVVGAVLFLVAAILLISNVDIIKAIFSKGSSAGDSDNEYSGAIPDMNAGAYVQGTDVFHSDDPLDIFSSVNVRDSFKWQFRVTTSYYLTHATESFSMIKSGDKYRVESSAKDIVYRDNTLYIGSDLYSLTTPAEVNAIYDEIGISTLDSVIAIAKNDNSVVNLSSDGKIISVIAFDSEKSLQSEYEISVEYGIVINETHYLNGQIIRSIATDSIDVFFGDSIPNEYFEIPTEQ